MDKLVDQIILASGNSHKLEEFQELFEGKINISLPASKVEVDETGTTFEENAFLKAKAYFDKFNTPSLSDDSGLVVAALPDELGIYSARFGEKDFNDKQRALHLLEKMSDKANRSAYFVCVLCLYLSADRYYFFQGRIKGAISRDYLGEGGFGYDPVFIPDTKTETLAMVPEWKQANSHRFKAVKQLLEFTSSAGLIS